MRTPEEIRQRNRRLDIAGCVLIVALLAAIAVDCIFGQWFPAAVLLICLEVTIAMTAWRRRIYRETIR